MFPRISKFFMACMILIAMGMAHQVEAGRWTRKADTLIKRRLMDSAVVDGKIYVMGGFWGPGSTLLPDVYEFDPALPHSVSNISPDRKISTY